MYTIDCIITKNSRRRIQIDVDESFELGNVKLECGSEVKVEKIVANDREILSTEYSIGTAVALINLRHPYLTKGTLILSLRNPLPRDIHLKATII